MKENLTIEDVAKICHEANKNLCDMQGDYSQNLWEFAGKKVQQSVINGVEFHLANPDATPENSHENWLKFKEDEGGWKYAPVKNLEAKEHPCFRPYAELPVSQQMKDHLFRSIVHGLAQFIER